MTDETTRDEIRDHLYQRLAETAESIRRGGAMIDEQVTTAFLGVGVTIAAKAFGPVQAAEWLREFADHVERGEKGLSDDPR